MFMVTIEGCFIVPVILLFSGWQDSFSLSRSVRALLIWCIDHNGFLPRSPLSIHSSLEMHSSLCSCD